MSFTDFLNAISVGFMDAQPLPSAPFTHTHTHTLTDTQCQLTPLGDKVPVVHSEHCSSLAVWPYRSSRMINYTFDCPKRLPLPLPLALGHARVHSHSFRLKLWPKYCHASKRAANAAATLRGIRKLLLRLDWFHLAALVDKNQKVKDNDNIFRIQETEKLVSIVAPLEDYAAICFVPRFFSRIAYLHSHLLWKALAAIPIEEKEYICLHNAL